MSGALAALVWALGSGGAAAFGPGETSCDPLHGWEEAAEASRGGALIFGETHGSNESPRAVREYVCAVAQRGDSVLLAVEFSSTRNDGFQTAWQAAPERFRSVLFERVSIWGEREDGVASTAMLDLLETLHGMADAGADIDIVAFNSARDDEQEARFAHLEAQGPHEAAQAENIAIAAETRPYDHVVVLVGSLHAKKVVLDWDGARFEPMALRLAGEMPVISLLQRDAGGESWNCRLAPGSTHVTGQKITADDVVCGPVAASADKGYEGEPRITLAAEGEEGFDGYYFLGEVTASAPPR